MKLVNKIAVITLVAGLCLPTIALAQTSERDNSEISDSIRTRLDEIKAKAKEEPREIKAETEERREEQKSNFEERLSKFLEKLVERYEAAVRRLERIIARIESRIDKLKTVGVDVTQAEGFLTQAKSKFDTASSSVESLISEVGDFTKLESPTLEELRAAYGEVKVALEVAKNDIKAAHEALVLVIKSLKPGRNNGGDARDDDVDDENE